MTTHDHLFVIATDRRTGTSSVSDVGQDLTAAMELYAAKEREAAERGDVEVVLVGSPSLEALQHTHSSYFGASAALAPLLSGNRR